MAKVEGGRVYSGKKFVILLFIGFVVFGAAMMFGTQALAKAFGPSLKANAEKQLGRTNHTEIGNKL